MSLNETQKAELRAKIAEDLKVLSENIRTLEEATQPIKPDVSLGRLTRMDAIQNKSVNEAALSDARHRKQKLERALERMENADFGECSSCGKPIAPARIAYMPETELCINCA